MYQIELYQLKSPQYAEQIVDRPRNHSVAEDCIVLYSNLAMLPKLIRLYVVITGPRVTLGAGNLYQMKHTAKR